MPLTPLYLKLVDVLLDLHRTRRSGVVRLEAGPAKVQLVIRAGSLAFAESNQPGEHLARILIGMKLIDRSDLTGVSAAMKAGKPTDEAIVTTCRIGSKELENAAREQAITIMASLFSWGEYRLQFYAGEAFNDRLINLQLPLPEIILDAVRRAVAVGNVPNPLKSSQGSVAPVDRGKAERLQLPLDHIESYTYSLITGPTQVSDLLPLLAAAEAKPFRVVQRLLLLGLIRIEDPQAQSLGRCAEASESNGLSEKVDMLLQRFEVASMYEILSVPTDAGADQIKSAYHEMARQYHPDRYQSEQFSAGIRAKIEKLFTYVTGAYATLTDPSARIAYDQARLKQESRVEAALQAKASADADKEKMAATLFQASRSALAKKEYEKAVNQLRECVWLCPDVSKYHHFLGVAQSEVPKFRKEAEKHLLKAIELNNSGGGSYLALGKLYMKVNLARRAQAQFEEVLRWDPTNPEALKMLETIADDQTGKKHKRIK